MIVARLSISLRRLTTETCKALLCGPPPPLDLGMTWAEIEAFRSSLEQERRAFAEFERIMLGP